MEAGKGAAEIMSLDSMADFHERLEKQKRDLIELSKRISSIEDSGKTGRGPEPMFDNKTIAMLIAIMIIPVALQVCGELLKRWQQQS